MTTTYEPRANDDGTFVIVMRPSCNLARDTNCRIFVTSDEAKAADAVAFLNAGKPRNGGHWLKSTFGLI
jgi:hypothetical protein